MADDVKTLVGRALAPTMVCLAHEHCRENQYVVREDMLTLTHRSLKAAVKGLDPLLRNTVLDKASDEAAAILKAANTDGAREMWATVAHLLMRMANRGVRFDADLILVATAIEADLVEFADEYGGMRQIDKWASKMENAANLRGWWLPSLLAV